MTYAILPHLTLVGTSGMLIPGSLFLLLVVYHAKLHTHKPPMFIWNDRILISLAMHPSFLLMH